MIRYVSWLRALLTASVSPHGGSGRSSLPPPCTPGWWGRSWPDRPSRHWRGRPSTASRCSPSAPRSSTASGPAHTQNTESSHHDTRLFAPVTSTSGRYGVKTMDCDALMLLLCQSADTIMRFINRGCFRVVIFNGGATVFPTQEQGATGLSVPHPTMSEPLTSASALYHAQAQCYSTSGAFSKTAHARARAQEHAPDVMLRFWRDAFHHRSCLKQYMYTTVFYSLCSQKCPFSYKSSKGGSWIYKWWNISKVLDWMKSVTAA